MSIDPGQLGIEVQRGRWLYRKGDPMPEKPGDDEDRSLKAALWYGYMLERAKVLMERLRVQRALEDDGGPDDRPPAAMAA